MNINDDGQATENIMSDFALQDQDRDAQQNLQDKSSKMDSSLNASSMMQNNHAGQNARGKIFG